MLEFFNTFFIKGANIYFGHKDKVYVVRKQLIIDVFGMCVNGYVKECKRTSHQVTSNLGLTKL
jgi:hypothetical protein